MTIRVQTCSAAVAGALLATVAMAPAAHADYPESAITMIVGFAAGGGTDAYARGLAAIAPEYLDGQPIAVVNMEGGAGMPAARSVADSPPDGYTLFLSSHGGYILRQLSGPQAADPFEDFEYVATVGGLTSGVMVPYDSPFESPQDIVDAARENPGELRWAHSGRGAAHYTAGIGFLLANDIEAQDVPFSGGGTARAALLSADVDFAFLGTQVATGFEDEIRLLAAASEERLPTNPDVPTFRELDVGYLGMTAPITVLAPKGTPEDIVAYLAEAFEGMVADQRYVDAMTNAELPVFYQGPEESLATARRLAEEWGPVIEATLEAQ